MNVILVLIISFYVDKKLNIRFIKFEQHKFFSFCFFLSKWLLDQIFYEQIAIILSQKNFPKQLCHFTGNILHHLQGFRLMKKEFHIQSNFKSSILFANRLFSIMFQNTNSEILLLSFERFSEYFFDFAISIMLKNNIIFSNIDFNKKTFNYETVCKITKGVYISCNLNKKNNIFFLIKHKRSYKKNNRLKKKQHIILITNRIKLCSFFLLHNNLKLCKFCFFCKNRLNIFFSEKYCSICKLFVLKHKYLILKIAIDIKKLSDKFSIFSYNYINSFFF